MLHFLAAVHLVTMNTIALIPPMRAASLAIDDVGLRPSNEDVITGLLYFLRLAFYYASCIILLRMLPFRVPHSNLVYVNRHLKLADSQHARRPHPE
jgi:hypothetical protein